MRARHLRWLEGYYLGTPLFALADWQFGANVRAVGLADHPELRALYYALCLGCGLLSWLRPAWGSFLGLAESSVNLLLLPLALYLPMFAMAERILDGEMVQNPITPSFVLNLSLSGAVWLALFYGRTGALAGSSRRLRT